MDKKELKKQFKQLNSELKKLQVGSKEYLEKLEIIRQIETTLNDIELQEARIKSEKMRAFWGAVAAIAGPICTVGVAVLNGIFMNQRVDKLKNIKDEQGIVDRDVMNMR